MKKYPYTRKRFGATFIDYVLIWGLTIIYILYFAKFSPMEQMRSTVCKSCPSLRCGSYILW